MKYKIAIVIPFFGNLPKYFPAWLKSAEANQSVDFLLFTDCKIKSNRVNIHCFSMTFDELICMYQNKLNRKIILKKPYKLCDYRGLIGVIYDDYLKNYDFWGWGDIDLMYGDIRQFITDDILSKYDRVYKYGHLTLMRNIPYINNLYKLHGSLIKYNDIFLNEFNMGFNEYCGMNAICEKNKINWYTNVEFADFELYLKNRLEVLHDLENYPEQLFVWEYGKIYQYFKSNDKIKRKELVYMHWQKRNPICENISDKNVIVLTNDKLIGFNSIEEVLSKPFAYFNPDISNKERKIQRKIYNKMKMKEFWSSSFKKKKVWISRKIFLKFNKNNF